MIYHEQNVQAQLAHDLQELVREKADADAEIKTSRDRIIVLKEEVERAALQPCSKLQHVQSSTGECG